MLLRRAIALILFSSLHCLLWSSTMAPAQTPMAPPVAQGQPQLPDPQPLPHPELPAPELPVITPDYTWLWILGGCMACGFVVLAWVLVHRHVTSPPPLPRARKNAILALQKLRDQADVTPPGEAAAKVSSIVRKYLQIAYEVPAPNRTSLELFHRSQAPEHLRSLAPLAEMWDRLAYGPAVNSHAEVNTLIGNALTQIEAEPEPLQAISTPTPAS